jgi:hypothetical protein
VAVLVGAIQNSINDPFRRRLHPELSAIIQTCSPCVLPDVDHTFGVRRMDLVFSGCGHDLSEKDEQEQDPGGVDSGHS